MAPVVRTEKPDSSGLKNALEERCRRSFCVRAEGALDFSPNKLWMFCA
jgi:hypothetical protein